MAAGASPPGLTLRELNNVLGPHPREILRTHRVVQLPSRQAVRQACETHWPLALQVWAAWPAQRRAPGLHEPTH